jgi:predicted GH43/DUF377 family glycosyl hydrolase
MDNFGEKDMNWIKKGLIFTPDKGFYWMQSHAQMPTVDHLKGDIYRVYFASRDKDQRSHIGYIEIDITEPKKIIRVSEKPVLEPGPIGFFDADGVFPSSIVNHNGKKYLYYIGWNKGGEPPLFYASIGLAISEDGGKSFWRYSKAPIMSRSEYDPCLVTGPFVLKRKDIWRMFYVSGIKWERIEGKLKSFYHIKYAHSKDGIEWIREGEVTIGLKGDSNISRPSVIREGDLYKAWYSYATLTTPYRIGYAESTDGIHFTRKDEEAGIDVSKEGFDNEMVCYPYVIKHREMLYMFYNGNNLGKEGIGLAITKE